LVQNDQYFWMNLLGILIIAAALSTVVIIFVKDVMGGKKKELAPVSRNAVIEKMTSAVLILDNQNRIMDMNRSAEAFFGLDAERASGKHIENELGEWEELVNACMNKIDHTDFVSDERHYSAYFSELSEGHNSFGSVVIITDVTDSRQAEMEAYQREKALITLQERNWLAREMHDSIGQVMSYTILQIESIRKMLESGKIHNADSTLVRLSKVIEEANAGVREFIYGTRTSLIFSNGFLTAMQKYISHYEESFGISVEVENRGNITDEDIDLSVGVQLFRIMQEALTNVRKHAQASKVIVTYTKGDDSVFVSISDNGVGFSAEDVDINKSFGLTIMRDRARDVGGDILIDSSPSKGTTVTVILPIFTSLTASATNELVKPVVENASEDHAVTVLLADDHVLFMDGLKNLLDQYGFRVVGKAKDGLEAIEKARFLKPDLILIDLQMPRCNGIVATKILSSEMPDTKIIVLTMSDREGDLFEAIRNGASGYLLKGLDTEDFIEQLRGIVANGVAISPDMASQVMKELKLSENYPEPEPDTSLRTRLSPRQIKILSLVSKGHTYKEVAAKLYISERTVKYQMSDILKQLNLNSRNEAITLARKLGLVNEDVVSF
jgi:PAS domain S-box-containing protein